MILAPGQIRAARALLGMSQRDLSAASGISEPTIKRMENDNHGPAKTTAYNAETVLLTLEKAGVVFLKTEHGPGLAIRTKQEKVETG